MQSTHLNSWQVLLIKLASYWSIIYTQHLTKGSLFIERLYLYSYEICLPWRRERECVCDERLCHIIITIIIIIMMKDVNRMLTIRHIMDHLPVITVDNGQNNWDQSSRFLFYSSSLCRFQLSIPSIFMLIHSLVHWGRLF